MTTATAVEWEGKSLESQIGVRRWERDGYFGVSFDEDSYVLDTYGSIGSGPVRREGYFGSEEAREYYIALELVKRARQRCASELKCAYDQLSEIETLHGAWRNLLQALLDKFKG